MSEIKVTGQLSHNGIWVTWVTQVTYELETRCVGERFIGAACTIGSCFKDPYTEELRFKREIALELFNDESVSGTPSHEVESDFERSLYFPVVGLYQDSISDIHTTVMIDCDMRVVGDIMMYQDVKSDEDLARLLWEQSENWISR